MAALKENVEKQKGEVFKAIIELPMNIPREDLSDAIKQFRKTISDQAAKLRPDLSNAAKSVDRCIDVLLDILAGKEVELSIADQLLIMPTLNHISKSYLVISENIQGKDEFYKNYAISLDLEKFNAFLSTKFTVTEMVSDMMKVHKDHEDAEIRINFSSTMNLGFSKPRMEQMQAIIEHIFSSADKDLKNRADINEEQRTQLLNEASEARKFLESAIDGKDANVKASFVNRVIDILNYYEDDLRAMYFNFGATKDTIQYGIESYNLMLLKDAILGRLNLIKFAGNKSEKFGTILNMLKFGIEDKLNADKIYANMERKADVLVKTGLNKLIKKIETGEHSQFSQEEIEEVINVLCNKKLELQADAEVDVPMREQVLADLDIVGALMFVQPPYTPT
ncbi:MAG: hypothetical protein KGH49_01475 [Candidatus Micrarchaeota archaeon]|nr:hypothetical protein [Candidatus Micrarchaeota archaeon]